MIKNLKNFANYFATFCDINEYIENLRISSWMHSKGNLISRFFNKTARMTTRKI